MFNLKTTIQVACGAYSMSFTIITGIMPKRLSHIKSTVKEDMPNVSNVSLPHGFLHLKLQKQRTVKKYLNVLNKLSKLCSRRSILYRMNMDSLTEAFLVFCPPYKLCFEFYTQLIMHINNIVGCGNPKTISMDRDKFEAQGLLDAEADKFFVSS